MNKIIKFWIVTYVMLLFLVTTGCEHKHNFTEWRTVIEATCSSLEVQERVCASCGEKETNSVGSYVEHSLCEWKTIMEATCTTLETQEAICRNCNKKETKTIGTYKEHSFGDWTLDETGKCENYLQEKRICSECGYTEYQYTDIKVEHDFSEWEYKDSIISRNCFNCNSIEEIDFYNTFITDGNGSVEFVEIVDDELIVKPVPNDGYYFLYWELKDEYQDNYYGSILQVNLTLNFYQKTICEAIFTSDSSLILPIDVNIEVENNLKVEIEYLPYVNKNVQCFSYYVHANEDLVLVEDLSKIGSFISHINDGVKSLPYYTIRYYTSFTNEGKNLEYVKLKFVLASTQ